MKAGGMGAPLLAQMAHQHRARAMLGHSDRGGQNTSWITSHLSQGCSKQSLINIGGAGHIYCFAANWTGHSVASMNARPSGSEPVKTSC
jgi:hypothetical protein